MFCFLINFILLNTVWLWLPKKIKEVYNVITTHYSTYNRHKMKGLRIWLPAKRLVNQDYDLSSSTRVQYCAVFVERPQCLVLKTAPAVLKWYYNGVIQHVALAVQNLSIMYCTKPGVEQAETCVKSNTPISKPSSPESTPPCICIVIFLFWNELGKLMSIYYLMWLHPSTQHLVPDLSKTSFPRYSYSGEYYSVNINIILYKRVIG